MNLGIIRLMLGRLLWIIAGLMVFPLFVALFYQESWHNLLALSGSIVLALLGGLVLRIKMPTNKQMFAREGFILCALSWLALSIFGALPFYFSGAVPSYVDALFETASGFTTTGASVLTNVEALPKSMAFWRSFTHLIGGMGVLVFILAILPANERHSSSIYLMKAEVPGPTFDKLLSKIKDTSRILYQIYLAMTMVLILLLMAGGMSLFDACIHAFGTAGTGGFSNYAAGVGSFHSPYIEYVLGVGMLLFGINFNLYYLLLLKQFKSVFKDEELRWFLSIVGIAMLLISGSLWSSYTDHWRMFRDVFFTVSSVISTTGFATVNFGAWPLFAQVILLGLMFFGSCAGSTAGGLKISRVALIFKSFSAEIKSTLNPNRIVRLKFNAKPVPAETVHGIHSYFVLYIIIFAAAVLLVSPYCNSLLTAVSSVAATLNNIGPGLDAVGPSANFAFFPTWPKLLLTLTMIIGRLEILPVILLFSPRAWKKGC